MTTLQEIESAAAELSRARARLEGLLTDMQSEVSRIEKVFRRDIRPAFERAAGRQNILAQLIDENRHLFDKPKSRVVMDLKFGLRKGKGGIDFEDEEHVIALIGKKLPYKKDLLIKTSHKLLKGGLNQLDVGELRAIGCTVEDTGDTVFVQGLDSALKKQINRMLAESTSDQGTAD